MARAAVRAHAAGGVSEQPRRDVHRRDAPGGTRVPVLRDGRRRCRLRQRRRRRSLRHGARAEPAVPQRRELALHRRHGPRGRRRPGLLDQRRMVRRRRQRDARPVRRQLRAVVDRQGPVLHARRQDEVLLHARVVQGPERHFLQEPRRRHVRGRDPEGGPVRPERQGHGRGAHRRHRRRPHRPLRRQRHAAQPPLSEQGRRYLRGRRGVGRCGVQRGRRSPGRDGRRRRRLRRVGATEPHHRQLRERDDGPLQQRGHGAVHRRGAAVDARTRHAAEPHLRVLLLRCRPGRPARHLLGERSRGRRHRARAAQGEVRAAGPPVPQSRRAPLRRSQRARRARRSRGLSWDAAPPTATTTTTATSTC